MIAEAKISNPELNVETELEDYSMYLKAYNIQFNTDKLWIGSGVEDIANKWLLFLSIRPVLVEKVLTSVLPIIVRNNVSFRLIKSQKLHYAINEGYIFNSLDNSENAVPVDFARAMILYPESVSHAKSIAKEITLATREFNGPEIVDAKRIANILYTLFSKEIPNTDTGQVGYVMDIFSDVPFPFQIQKAMPKFELKRRLYNRHYIPIEVLRNSSKGIIYKAINIKSLSLTWCLLKVGKAFSFEDNYNRDTRDRLRWEFELLSELQKDIRVPKPLAFFYGKNVACLALEWIEGQPLKEKLKVLRADIIWKELDDDCKLQILSLYTKILSICQTLHGLGYIHRDLTYNNFIVENSSDVCAVDFELTYSVRQNLPENPFQLGTFGFISPQQLAKDPPQIGDDIFALGALLLYFISGINPDTILREHDGSLVDFIFEISESQYIADLIINCLRKESHLRPESVAIIGQQIKNYLDSLTKYKQ